MACVYCHIRLDNDQPFYVGIGKTEKRAFNMKSNRNIWHKRIVEKHGARVQVIIKNIDWDIACWWEVRWIKALRNAGYELVNMTDGGEGTVGFYPSDEIRKKMSIARKGKKKTEDHIQKISIKLIGNKNGIGNKNNLGKKHSEQSRQKMSRSQTGRTHTEETKIKMSKSATKLWDNQNRRDNISKKLTGKNVSKETRAKQSADKKDKTQSEEHKKNIGIASAKMWASKSAVEKTASANKAWETRRRNAAAKIAAEAI